MIYVLLFLLLLIIGVFLFLNAGPKLPAKTDDLIKEIQAQPLLEVIIGKTGKAQNGAIDLYYEILSDSPNPKETILLINGHTQTFLDWPVYFYEPLVAAGYRVIRYDNRGVGMSDWIEDWTKATAYTLEEMATDGLAVLDTLGIPKAHIIGVSMGGMIAQRIAISHPNRIMSLTSIMSTGGLFDEEIGDVPRQFMMDIGRIGLRYGRNLKTETGKLKLHLAIRRLLQGKGDYDFDDKRVLQKALYEVRKRKGYNMKATDQHSLAIKKSGLRYEELTAIQVPTLVVHGTTDPLIPFAHGQKYAKLIPDVATLFVEGMGHDLPAAYTPKIVKAILELLKKATKERVV